MPISGSAASVTAFDGVSIATITGLTDIPPGLVGRRLGFSGALWSGNNGTFTITSWLSSTSVQIDNAGAFAPDVNNLTISWLLENIEFDTPASDTVAVLDFASAYNAVLDTVATSEALTSQYGAQPNTQDTVVIGDQIDVIQTKFVSLAENIESADSLFSQRITAPHLGTETVSLSAAFTPHAIFQPPTQDTVALVDRLVAHRVGSLDVSDTVVAADQVIASHSSAFSVSESVAVSDHIAVHTRVQEHAVDSVSLAETLDVVDGGAGVIDILEVVEVFDRLAITHQTGLAFVDSVGLSESLSVGSGSVVSSGVTLTVNFPYDLRIEGIVDPAHYAFSPIDGGLAFDVLSIEPVTVSLASGIHASVVNQGAIQSYTLLIPDGSFTGQAVNTYLAIGSLVNTVNYLRIVNVIDPHTVVVDKPLVADDPQNGSILWQQTSGVSGLLVTITKPTNKALYLMSVSGLSRTNGSAFDFQAVFVGVSAQPRVSSVRDLGNGQILVTYDSVMRVDDDLTDPAEYSLLPTMGNPVSILGVKTVSATQVVIQTTGMTYGSHQLVVNATGTPKDLEGNPIDPAFNTVVFTASTPTTNASIFVDKGPIARPPLTLQMGVGMAFISPTNVTLTGGSFGSNLVGLYLTLVGTGQNDGSYQIISSPANNQLQVRASFNLPDSGQLLAAWSVYDPRDGEIADDPAHVTVRINGVPTRPEAVVGLLGQIVMATPPGPTDDVRVDYSWVRNPTVEIRRLNSTEFRLNNWNRDNGRLHDPSGHKYRFNNVLPVPSNFTSPAPIQQGSHATVLSTTVIQVSDGNLLTNFAGLNIAILSGVNAGVYDILSVPTQTTVTVAGPLVVSALPVLWTVGDSSDLQARLPQPLLRDLKYRAYERAYTAVLNDPNSLLLNSPVNSIAYPLLQRTLTSTFVSYEPTGLPENDLLSPWNRVGAGNVSLLADELIVTPVPLSPGNYIYWNQTIDLTFPYVFAATWQNRVTSTPTTQGVFTGVSFGYSDNKRAVIVGYLLNGSQPMIGFLKQGSGNDPSLLTSWTGGLDANGNPTGAPMALDWTVDHSYRTYQDPSGTISLYLDGEIVANMQVTESQLPYLEELNTPFNTLQGVYFGNLGQTTLNTSVWDFTRYTILPVNPLQTAPSIFVNYEANTIPEVAQSPWTPLGYHGTETILNNANLLLDSTSAVASSTTLVGGDFRGYTRLEPLLATDATIYLDIDVGVRTWTHGITPNAVTAMVDDGSRLMQLSFLADVAAPKFSYGGDSLPTVSTPVWEEITVGVPTASMLGRTLQVSNSTSADGLLFIIDDSPIQSDPGRVVGLNDYILEARILPLTYTSDPTTGFTGAVAQVYDSTKTLGFYLADNGSRSIVLFGLDTFGVVHIVATLAFEWKTGSAHTYRLVYAHSVGLVSLFIDGLYITTENYSAFPSPAPNPVGYVSFGSSIPGSQAASKTNWIYCNAWRVGSATRHYVGLWKGDNPQSFLGYHMPTKTVGRNALIVGNALADGDNNFITQGVTEGDILVVDVGPNQGSYVIASAPEANTLTIDVLWPKQPGRVNYRILKETDWTQQHRYRLSIDPMSTEVSILLDSEPTPLFIVDYTDSNLPPSSVGLPRLVSGSIPSLMWGALDPTNLSQTNWSYVRYGVTRSPTELRIVPPHQVLNQRNTIASPEHLTTNIPHTETDYWSSSQGIPPQSNPDLLKNPGMTAYTLLNEGTPLVPSTQTYEVRRPHPKKVFLECLNNPADCLNDNSFKLNDASSKIQLVVPPNVLYNQLSVIERDTGSPGLIAPFTDMEAPVSLGTLFYTKTVCLNYDAETLPENDVTAGTPWVYEAGDPSHVNRSIFEGTLTYGTDNVGTQTVYRNATPLTDSISLGLSVKFRLKLLLDGSGGMSDSNVRFGFSSFGMTLALAFVSVPTGLRYVLCYDLASETIIGGVPFDFYDGNVHEYKIVRQPGVSGLRIFIDS